MPRFSHEANMVLANSMDFHGTAANNLSSAVRSARRLRGHPVHADTIAYWRALLENARRERSNESPERIEKLILELENELAERTP